MPKQFSGPVDVVRETIAAQGPTGMWRGLPATFLYRSSFLAMFGGASVCFFRPWTLAAWAEPGSSGFEVFNRLFMSWEGTSWAMSKELSNFLAGGMASNLYWAMALREFRRDPEVVLSRLSLKSPPSQHLTTSRTGS